MLPPDTTQIVKTLDPPAIFYWSAYGIPIAGIGGAAFYGPAPVIMPSPPPLAFSEQRMLLTFGDANQNYNYCPWELIKPEVTKPVKFITGIQVIYRVTDWPPPYKPYWKVLGGQPVGADGKFVASTMKLMPPQSKPNMVPQSFIGISPAGYLTICLQTNTKANYKGYAYQLDRLEEIMAVQGTFLPVGIGHPPQPGPGISGYWDGFQFHYKDISNEIMGAGPECFVLGGAQAGLEFPLPPRVNDKTWHHLLFSFDISGTVTSDLPAVPISGGVAPPSTSTTCKAWLALDDKNYTGPALQHAIPVPNGISAPQLDGMGMNGVFPFGPDASFSRLNLALGPNDIVPQNVWIRGFWGNPRDGLPRFDSAAGFAPGNPYVAEGYFNYLVYSGVEWVLARLTPSPGAPGFGSLNPPKPTNPDPAVDLDTPKYNCAGFSIPTQGHPIGIPVSTHHLKHNTGLEMAELQIWANRTLDTDNVAMRRLFIDWPKDRNGNPDTSKPLQPVLPSKAEEVLGKPDILLNGTENWKEGRNTGAVGIDSRGKSIPSGQFTPVANIEKFLPDPEIGV